MGELNINNEDERQKYLKNYFTEAGIKALNQRRKDLIELYLKNPNYPLKGKCFGFPILKIHSKQHHEGMIDEISQILGILKNIIEVTSNGNKKY